MRLIKASNREIYARVDDEDYDLLVPLTWTAVQGKTHRSPYLKSFKLGMYMHRFILGASQGDLVDHIDMDTTNNQKENLRICSRAENGRNRGKTRRNSSGFKGVSWHKKTGKWRARIRAGQEIHLGLFDSAEEAYKAYTEASVRLHKDFARG